jgi:hypothetical protein
LRTNDYEIEVGKGRGEFVRHAHPDADDVFLGLAGRLTMQSCNRQVEPEAAAAIASAAGAARLAGLSHKSIPRYGR